MAAMTCERFRLERTSAIDSPTHFREIVSLLKTRRKVKGMIGVHASMRHPDVSPFDTYLAQLLELAWHSPPRLLMLFMPLFSIISAICFPDFSVFVNTSFNRLL